MAENRFSGWGGKGGDAAAGPSDIVFSNVQVLNGSGEPPFSGEVTVSGNRIKSITRTGSGFGGSLNSWSTTGSTRIDGRGMTLMPGLIDAHLHLSWNNAPGINPIQMMPIEEHMLNCVYMSKIVLDAGFTAGCGAAAAKPRLDVVIRDAIRSGKVPGPRYTAAGPELTSVGGLGDASLPHIDHEGLNLGIVVSGVEDMRRNV
ncbi:MAG TPA: amidohydrolase family protein, partial [Rhodospirillaceae bacterium]|nr:amidohydrolase family protein [Rhodospirillaceae bacterium]